MKKVISFLLSMAIVFSACFYSVNADEVYCENVDYPCYKFFRIFAFDKDNYNKDLSKGVASCSFDKGNVTITPDLSSDTTTVYFNIDGENRAKLLKAVVAIKQCAKNYSCETFLSGNENEKGTANIRFGLLDEKLTTLSSANAGSDLTLVMADYFCISIKLKDTNASNSHSVSINGFYFEWNGEHTEVTSERDVGGYILHSKYCAVCGYSFSGMPYPPNRHITSKMQEVPASCSQTGLTGGWKCNKCGEIVYPQKEIAKLPHTEVVDKAVAPTYTKTGLTKGKHCSVCKKVIVKQKVVAKLTLKTPKFKLTKGKKQFKVKYTKVSGATGFEVRYKLKGKWKSVKVNTKKSMTKTIKKLKKGKYQVQIRAFVKQNKKVAYSKWSSSKKVTVK